MQSVKGLNVLVTGAAMGLGKLFATNAVKEGAAAVVLWDVNEDALKETTAALEGLGLGLLAEVAAEEVGPRDHDLARGLVGPGASR